MSPRALLSLIVALLLSSSGALRAQTITVSGNPGLLRISAAVAGSQPTSVTDASRTFTITTPVGGGGIKYQVLMSLDANMPAGTTLTATLAAPAGSAAVSAPIALDITPRAALTNIKKNYSGSASMTYQLDATAAAGVVPNTSRTVTLTITTFP